MIRDDSGSEVKDSSTKWEKLQKLQIYKSKKIFDKVTNGNSSDKVDNNQGNQK